MDLLQKIRLVWEKIGLVQRAMLLAIVLTAVGAGALLVRWARQPDMQLLYQGVAPEDAAKIVDKISAQNILYELRSGGTSIYVPKEQVYRLRLDMAKEGLPAGGQTGYKIFESEKIGVSPFVQNVNLKRALQEELAKSIQMIEGVAFARVHLDNPDPQLFTSEDVKTTASVILQLRPGYTLAPSNVAAITNLVAGSLSGLRAENVTIIDNHGNLLSSRSDSRITSVAGSVYDYRAQVEQSLGKKVEDMLATVLGPDRAAVRVSAVIDMNNVSLLTETITAGVEKKIEETKEPTTITTGQNTTQGTPKTTTTTEMAPGKTVRQETMLPGEIKSLSVSAVVDLYPEDPNQTATLMPLKDVEDLIKSALGFKETRDTLKVTNVRFNRRKDLAAEEPVPTWTKYLVIARHASMGVMAVCALLVFKILTGARKKAAVAEAAAVPALPGGAPGNAGMLPGGQVNQAMLRQHVAGALKSNPEQVRQLFATWVQQS
jgi:flagellar M-ring protein FliF